MVRGSVIRNATEFRNILSARSASIKRIVVETQNQTRAELAEIKLAIKKMQQTIRMLVSRPAITLQQGPQAQPIILARPGLPRLERPAILARNVKTLSVLWDEWQNGLNGSKLASQFTSRERGGANKNRFILRNNFWKCMVRLIRGGCEVSTAIQRIEDVYGTRTVTKVLQALRQDERNGGHASLRV